MKRMDSGIASLRCVRHLYAINFKREGAFQNVFRTHFSHSLGIIIDNRFASILLHAGPETVGDAQTKLSLGVSLLGSFANPFHRFGIILRHALTLGVAESQIVLSGRSALICRLAKPLYRYGIIYGYAVATGIADAKIELSFSIPSDCDFFEFFVRN